MDAQTSSSKQYHQKLHKIVNIISRTASINHNGLTQLIQSVRQTPTPSLYSSLRIVVGEYVTQTNHLIGNNIVNVTCVSQIYISSPVPQLRPTRRYSIMMHEIKSTPCACKIP